MTGPHVTGTDKVIVQDEDGEIIWKTAESNTSNIKYEPEYDSDGKIIGQTPISQIEPQTQTMEQIPQIDLMKISDAETDMSEELRNEFILDHNLSDENSELFCFLKSEAEEILAQNGYDIPVRADGSRSRKDDPVFSVGVKKGQSDVYGMTTTAGMPAVKTVYGAAVQDILIDGIDEETTALDILNTVLVWYQEHPQWSFGGIHAMDVSENGCKVTLYAGVSVTGSRSFFTMKEVQGKLTVDSVYTVLENPATLR